MNAGAGTESDGWGTLESLPKLQNFKNFMCDLKAYTLPWGS